MSFTVRLTENAPRSIRADFRRRPDEVKRGQSEAPSLRVVIAEDSALIREGIARLDRGVRRDRRRQGRRRRRRSSRRSWSTARTSRSSTSGCRRASATRACGRRSRRAAACPARRSSCSASTSSGSTRPSSSPIGAGGVGYLLKDRVGDIREFMDALRRVARGGTALDPEVVAQLMVRSRADDPLSALTPREREVLAAMAEGRTNVGIARAARASPRAPPRSTSATSSASSSCPTRRTTTAACWRC